MSIKDRAGTVPAVLRRLSRYAAPLALLVVSACGGASPATTTEATTTTPAPTSTTTTAAPTTTTEPPIAASDLFDALRTDGFFVASGASITHREAETTVGAARAAGSSFFLVVLSDSQDDDVASFAEDVFDVMRIPAGTVVVLTPDMMGWFTEGERFSSADLDEAFTYAVDLGGDDADYVTNFVAALTAPGTFDLVPGTPPAELTSFAGTVSFEMVLGDAEMSLQSVGTYVGDAYQCETTMGFGGFLFTTLVVATPDRVWIEQGQRFAETNLHSEDVDLAVGLCPASPAFWQDFDVFPGTVQGEPETLGGVPTQRVQLKELIDLMSDFGFGFDYQGSEIDEAVAWFADPGGWIAGLDISGKIDAEEVGEVFGPLEGDPGADATIMLALRIQSPNDESLTVADVTAGSVPSDPIETNDISLGDCFDTPEEDIFYEVDLIDCDDRHELEVYALIDLDREIAEFSASAAYPGDDVLYGVAIDLCLESFEGFVGVPYEESVLIVDALTPTFDGWTNQGDRIVNCVVFAVDDEQSEIVATAGTLRDARR